MVFLMCWDPGICHFGVRSPSVSLGISASRGSSRICKDTGRPAPAPSGLGLGPGGRTLRYARMAWAGRCAPAMATSPRRRSRLSAGFASRVTLVLPCVPALMRPHLWPRRRGCVEDFAKQDGARASWRRPPGRGAMGASPYRRLVCAKGRVHLQGLADVWHSCPVSQFPKLGTCLNIRGLHDNLAMPQGAEVQAVDTPEQAQLREA